MKKITKKTKEKIFYVDLTDNDMTLDEVTLHFAAAKFTNLLRECEQEALAKFIANTTISGVFAGFNNLYRSNTGSIYKFNVDHFEIKKPSLWKRIKAWFKK